MIDFSTAKSLLSKFTVTGAQKAHIDRLIFELGIFEKESAALNLKLRDKDLSISNLRGEVAALTAKNKELQAQLDNLNRVDGGLDEEESKILKFFFDAQESSREDAARSVGIGVAQATHYVGSLIKRQFLRQSKASAGPSRLAKFRITHEGSSHVMKSS